MKFAWKIFIITYLIVILSFGVGGFILVNSFFNESLNTSKSALENSNRLISNSYYVIAENPMLLSDAFVESYKKSITYENEDSKLLIGEMSEMKFSDEVADMVAALTAKENQTGGIIYENGGKRYYEVVSAININSKTVFIDSAVNITGIFETRDYNYRVFQILLLCVSVVSGGVLYLSAVGLTRPLKRIDKTAKSIGGGEFDKRVEPPRGLLGSSREINDLTEDFNRMADHIAAHIDRLNEENRRRDDFIANFTHELKTPLTSVIGYSELLRSFDLPIEKRRAYADCIYKEGTRLESLAANLLDLIVLDRESVELLPTEVAVLLKDVTAAVGFLAKKYSVKLRVKYERAIVMAQPDLIKTVLYNLVDNSCKNGGKNIMIRGKISDGRYLLTVTDNGCGIPSDQIEKVTEEFYMVDKSRARGSGGAGIGLSLCKRIARLHGGDIVIESKVCAGTAVSISLDLCADAKNGGEADE